MMRIIIILIATLFLLTGCAESGMDKGISMFTTEAVTEGLKTALEETASEEKSVTAYDTIYVYVCGAVYIPGVYALKKGDRAYLAIEAAGGVTEDAAAYRINLAAELTDGQMLYIPRIDESNYEELTDGTDKKDTRININTAGKDELMTLSGIGESKAEAIIRYRMEIGGFETIEQIMEVDGIKQAAFNRIKDKIVV